MGETIGYTRARLESAKQKSIAEARTRPPKKSGPLDMRVERRIPAEAVHQAILHEGQEVLSEAGEAYWRDMDRRYPWQVVKTETPARFSMHTPSSLPRRGRLTRFGRASFSKVY